MAACVPRGVVGADGRRAVVHDRHGTLIALDTETGAVLWRRGRWLRPCAVTGGAVVAVRLGGPPAPDGQGRAGAAGPVAVVVLDAEEGAERWTSPPLDLPSWARPSLDDTPAFTLAAETPGGGNVVLRWAARALYEGGAPPGRGAPVDTVREAHGAVRVRLAGPSPQVLPEPPGPPPGAEPETGPEAPDRAGPLDPDVLEAGRIGARRIELAVRRGTASDALVLRAVDPGADAPVWEVVLDEGPRGVPPRPRP
ncbi:PQQ-binding-like beta-propeller repeat protein [Streptomyces sp. TRM76323]|uniref:PQQ-binding-like beta-propeller repeat protein n=1 Tax=Streptomyces tamarix TaxID=3078565 RepID=A0ABU3QIX1_9ACTN|nr:PQQ-binding-like beta-propeller repeat protein [Streptomyces tamarix]MDT9682725.1 PQQ-binding-like beta-propeller repeat protein [Streptomyces tamarix]